MEKVSAIWAWVNGPQGVMLVLVLFGISEAVAQIPQIKANSVFQVIVNALGWIKGKLVKSA
jgi:hypothetical protein